MTFFRVGFCLLLLAAIWPLNWNPIKLLDTELSVCLGLLGVVLICISVGLALWSYMP